MKINKRTPSGRISRHWAINSALVKYSGGSVEPGGRASRWHGGRYIPAESGPHKTFIFELADESRVEFSAAEVAEIVGAWNGAATMPGTAKMKPRFSVRAAVASYLGEDIAEVENRRYQPTRTPCPVYTVGNRYLTATGGRVPKPSREYEWKEVDPGAWYGRRYGWRIWETLDSTD